MSTGGTGKGEWDGLVSYIFWNYECVDFYKFIDFVKGRINYEIWKTKDKKSVHAVS